MRKIIWTVLGVLIVIGVAVTIWDYRNWRMAELAKYGQGWGDLKAPALNLTTMYQNNPAGFRIRLPNDWKVTEAKPFLNSAINRGAVPLTFQSQEVININGIMTVNIRYADGNLPDIGAAAVTKITGGGHRLSRDWEYANSDKINMTVITWQVNLADGKTEVRQEAMAKKGNKLVEINTVVPFEKWGNYENTVWEIYKNTELL